MYNGIMDKQFFKYTVPATAVAVNFNLGAKPCMVEIINKGNVSGKPARAVWTLNMPDASAFVSIQATADHQQQALETTNGITPSEALTMTDPNDNAKTVTAPSGFTLGLLTGINAVANQGDILFIIAHTSVNHKAAQN